MSTQSCRVCEEEKPLSEFHFRRDSGKHRTECKDCRNLREAARRYQATVGDIEALRESQGNCCAICGTHSNEIEHRSFTTNPLVIDHCHASGEVRGLLCPTCNAGLGHFKDSPELLLNAIKYLKKGEDIV